MFGSDSISLGLVIVLALPLKNAFLYVHEIVLLIESDFVTAAFTNVTSMNLRFQ